MFRIYKEHHGYPNTRRKGRVVALDDIVRPCPLSPVIQGRATKQDEREGAASMEVYQEFWINSFASLNDYVCLR